MRIFKTKTFARSVRKALDDVSLWDAVQRAEQGHIDADLGGGLIKQRVARPGQGRSGGFRTVIAYRTAERSVFVYGFPKNQRANLRKDELEVYRDIATIMLGMDYEDIQTALDAGELIEIEAPEDDQQDEEEVSE